MVVQLLRRHQVYVALVPLLLGACNGTLKPLPRNAYGEAADNPPVIYVVRRKWHIEIEFAAADLIAPLASLGASFPGLRYLNLGFGDLHYLVAKDKYFPGLFAALWPGQGLILITGLTASSQAASGAAEVIPISVTVAQERAAQAFIWESLSKTPTPIKAYAVGPYQGSLYFSAKPRYSAFYTCNTWAAQVLQAAGLPVRSAGVIFAGQLWTQVVQIDHASRSLENLPPGHAIEP